MDTKITVSKEEVEIHSQTPIKQMPQDDQSKPNKINAYARKTFLP